MCGSNVVRKKATLFAGLLFFFAIHKCCTCTIEKMCRKLFINKLLFFNTFDVEQSVQSSTQSSALRGHKWHSLAFDRQLSFSTAAKSNV